MENNLSWNKDLYSRTLVQKNILTAITIILSLSIIVCLIWLKLTLSQNKIEPFIVEINSKTGIATTVEPITVKNYSANKAVLKSLIIQYIRAREEYIHQIYNRNLKIVKLFSNSSVYRQYSTLVNMNNPTSPYTVLGKNGTINVKWKSIIFPQENTAQIRITLEIHNAVGNVKQIDKIILMSFEFLPDTVESEDDRTINPLGFSINMYKIEDENPNI